MKQKTQKEITKLTPNIQGWIGEWMAHLKLYKMGFRGISRAEYEVCSADCLSGQALKCRWSIPFGFLLEPIPVDSCPRGKKWFKLMMYIKRINEENLPGRPKGSAIPFDYYAFPKELFPPATGEEFDKAMVLVEVKTGKSELTHWQRKILEYAKSLGTKVLILRIDSYNASQFYKLADKSVHVENL